MHAQDAQNPWHLVAFENGEEVAFYNVEVITGIEVTGQSVTVVLDNGKEFSHPVTATIFSFDPRTAGTGTPNENMASQQWNVRYANGRMYFNTPVNGIAVYSTTGASVAQFTGSYSEAPVNLPTGIYVVQSGGKNAKLPVSNGKGSAVNLRADAATFTRQDAPVRLRADVTVKTYWNITSGNTTTAIDIPDVEKFYFTSGKSITFMMKDGNTMELANYRSSEFSVEPVNVMEEVPPAEPIDLTVRQREKVNADNRFAFKMFREVSVSNGANTFFSPLSLNMALGMLYNGASGDTRSEMAEAFGMADYTDLEINEYYRKMSQALLSVDPLTDIGIANSIWHMTGFSVYQPFIDINREYFDAMVTALDFSQPDAADIINAWCAEKTKDKIDEIVNKPIPGDIVMYLINALYFKSKWQFEFDKTLTKKEEFTTAGNRKVTVNMMEQFRDAQYYGDQYLQCVEMPYGNEAFSMLVVLPKNTMDIDQLIAYLDDTAWQTIVNSTWAAPVLMKLPRFKIECELSLNNPVMNAGMKQIFSGGFANMSDVDLAVSEIKQKTFVEVNEEGTEAAAASSIGMTGQGPGYISFVANRPFLYLIKEKSTGTVLFIGRMDEPEE